MREAETSLATKMEVHNGMLRIGKELRTLASVRHYKGYRSPILQDLCVPLQSAEMPANNLRYSVSRSLRLQ